MSDNDNKFLSLFLGPKAENATQFEELFLLVLRDYFHWRRNYFPGDQILITKELQRNFEEYYDRVYQTTLELTAELRRNFPFYSSRYIAHMLSDTLIPSMLGYLAGMLYNPNNVTPEAAPVTVDMEIEACNIILQMLGYTPPPDIPKEYDKKSIEDYKKELQREFGWGHLTIGGTIANIEALWIARTVKYAPLAIWYVSKQQGLNIEIGIPGIEKKRDIKKCTRKQVLSIKPNEAIYLLAKYVDAVRRSKNISVEEAGKLAQELLNQSKYSLNKGFGTLFKEFPPVVFVSGMAHYSIAKAANILGIGVENVKIVKADSQYRMSVESLEQEINFALAQGKIPLAVIGIAGTTEEGSVDPIHDLLDLREKFEEEKNTSFWLHVDAAWGGYLRSLFNLTIDDEVNAILANISDTLGLEHKEERKEWVESFFTFTENQIDDLSTDAENLSIETREDQIQKEAQIINELMGALRSERERLNNLIRQKQPEEFLNSLTKFINTYKKLGLQDVTTSLKLLDRINVVNQYVSDEVILNWGQYSSSVLMQWGSKDVCSSLLAMSKADSITIDPHKMGYINYPCGMVAFKNDRVRHFILQKAPYISSVRQDVLVHMPPRHLEDLENDPRIITEAFAPFIVEGSRPGAAASALWTTIKTLPPTIREAGSIIRASLLASRELYEWLVHWETAMKYVAEDTDYSFIPLTSIPPDTNVVIFAVKKKTSNSLENMNRLTGLVYEEFTIQSELGEREYSYSQPFFLSKTLFSLPNYAFDSLRPILGRYFEMNHLDNILQEYKNQGIVVLRATVMNPYINVSHKLSDQDVLKEFMEELSRAAKKCVSSI